VSPGYEATCLYTFATSNVALNAVNLKQVVILKKKKKKKKKKKGHGVLCREKYQVTEPNQISHS
jgi:hypothetical protein